MMTADIIGTRGQYVRRIDGFFEK